MTTLPNGFPSRLEGPMVWDGSEYDGKPELYTEVLAESELLEIHRAVTHFNSLDLKRGFISKANFPLSPDLSAKLRNINDEINSGRGFQVLRGIDPSEYSEYEHVILFAGLASHIASDRAAFVDHIRHALKDEAKGEDLRPPELPCAMDFHTDADSGNILALFLEQQGKSGGRQYISSFWRAYNELALTRPDVLSELSADWYWEKPKRITSGKGVDILHRAIMGQVDGKPQINFGRSFVAGDPRYPLTDDAPPLSGIKEDALCYLMELAKKHSFQVDTKVGDILFVNNLSIMHARDAFEDDQSEGKARHVIRLWLKDNDTSWPIDPALKYKNENLWGIEPELQRLCSVTEWEQTPRSIRLQGMGTAMNHD